jgi:hypothetical protein
MSILAISVHVSLGVVQTDAHIMHVRIAIGRVTWGCPDYFGFGSSYSWAKNTLILRCTQFGGPLAALARPKADWAVVHNRCLTHTEGTCA